MRETSSAIGGQSSIVAFGFARMFDAPLGLAAVKASSEAP
jgi:hypothetical protein